MPLTTKRTAVTLTAGLIALLITVSAMPPLGTAAYLAGLPLAAADLGVSTAAAQLTLTVYIIGMALGQIIIGPLSDRIGRRGPLLTGIAAFVIFSAAIAFSPSFETMLALRLLQGFAASSGMVLGRAIVHDLARGEQAARAMNVISAAGLIVPALAPLLGSTILSFADWRTIFLVLAALGAGVGMWALLRLPETGKPDGGAQPAPKPQRAATQPNTLRFIMYTSTVALAFMAMYAYISSAPFVFQQFYGLSPAGYAWSSAVLSLIMAAVGVFGSRLIGRTSPWGAITPSRAATAGLVWMLAGALLVGASVLTEAGIWWYFAALAIAIAPAALISGSATALAMDASPLQGGTSSAVIGFTQALFGAASPALVGILGIDVRPMAVVLIAASALALTATSLASQSTSRDRRSTSLDRRSGSRDRRSGSIDRRSGSRASAESTEPRQ